ncbi:MAG TPA: calcium-binding protein [Tepidisphaeraceae bacterium]|nr:calcium-binding protein [Tepidisphaeraceae bacterium]
MHCLEGRRLLSATLHGQILHITGTADHDRLSIHAGRGQLIVNQGGGHLSRFRLSLVRHIAIEMLGGNDIVRLSDAVRVPATIDGGEGNDVLRGGAGADALSGGGGNDRLGGATGNDTCAGDAGNDAFPAAAAFDGNDRFVGGEGRDVLDYSQRHDSVAAGLSDGQHPVEDATDATMEIFVGGAADDILIIEAPLPLTGGFAAFGRAGDDVLESRRGDNLLHGGDGDDRLVAMFASATLLGGAGNDSLRNFKGTDIFLNGGPGDDTFDVIEGLRSDIRGGTGQDTLDCRGIQFGPPVVSFDDLANDRVSSIELNGEYESNVHSDVEHVLAPPT